MELIYAHKKGEEADPAGGETGVPHCLAEAYILLKKSNIYIKFKKLIFKFL